MFEITTTQKARKFLLIGLLGAFLTLLGDFLIGYIKFPEGAGMLEGYFAAALMLPIWRPILGGMIGFLGISLEFLGLITLYPLLKRKMPKGAAFYKLSMYVYLAVAGGAVHLPCGVFMWLYHSITDAAGQETGYNIALQYVLYFILPVTIVFFVFFCSKIQVFGALECAMRQNDLAWEVRDYLKIHPKAAVVNLGCGLDQTGRNCDNGSCLIYNIDFPDVIQVRDELLPAGDRERNIAADLNDFHQVEAAVLILGFFLVYI